MLCEIFCSDFQVVRGRELSCINWMQESEIQLGGKDSRSPESSYDVFGWELIDAEHPEFSGVSFDDDTFFSGESENVLQGYDSTRELGLKFN